MSDRLPSVKKMLEDSGTIAGAGFQSCARGVRHIKKKELSLRKTKTNQVSFGLIMNGSDSVPSSPRAWYLRTTMSMRERRRSFITRPPVTLFLSTLVGLCSGHFLKLTRSQYTSLRSSGNYNSWISSPSPRATPSLRPNVQIVFIPSFQGTLLQNAEAQLPLFLAPLSRTSYKRLYALLRSEHTHALPDEDAVEYPNYGCKNHSGHFSHCLPVPLRGAVSQLREKYKVQSLGYDWRQANEAIYNGAFGERIRQAMKCDNCVIIAHGSGCSLLRYAVSQGPTVRSRTACISPVTARTAYETKQGDGLTTAGDAHTIGDCMKSVRERKIDFGSMAGELGMLRGRKGRSALPAVEGLDYDEIHLVPRQERSELVNSFDASRDLGVNDGAIVQVCVEGMGEVMKVDGVETTGDGVVEKGSCRGVADQILAVPARHLDLVRMVDAAVMEFYPNR